jgi:hypothetical protein
MTRRAREHYPVAMIQVRHFIPWAKIAGSLLILTGGATACVTGLNPLLRVSHGLRSLILSACLCNIFAFLFCIAMLLVAWLIDRYGDLPSDRPPGPS